jgi:uncharacterized protein involved in exopolysaccharide biosynthesis
MREGTLASAAGFVDLGRAWWLPLTLAAIFGVSGFLWASLTEKTYRVETVLAPTTNDPLDSGLSQLAGQYAGIASMLGVNLSSTGRTEEIAIATLRSRQFTADFLQAEGLLPMIFGSGQRYSEGGWRSFIFGGPPTLAKAVQRFDTQIRSVRQDRRTGLVHLTIEWRDPDVAAEWANKMVRAVNGLMRDRAIAEAERSISFLSDEASKTNIVGVQQAAYGLMEAQLNRITLAKVREDYAFQIVDPATAPDDGDYTRPRRTVLVIFSASLGFGFGVLGILLVTRSRRVRIPV